MNIGQGSYPVLSLEQNNPVMYGLIQSQQLQQQKLANALAQNQLNYAPQMSQADLALKQNQGALTGQEANWYGPSAQADIASKMAGASLNNANAVLAGSQNQLLQGTMPYDIQHAAANVYPAGPVATYNQANIASQQGGPLANALRRIGFYVDQGQGQQGGYNTGSPQQSPAQDGNRVPPFLAGNTPQQPQMLPQSQADRARLASMISGSPSMNTGGVQPSAMLSPKMYGGSSPLDNYALTGSPYGPLFNKQINAIGDGLSQQAKNSADVYSKNMTDASNDGADATQLITLAKNFDRGYQASTNKGQAMGGVASTGTYNPATWIGNMSPEQYADTSAKNMIPLTAKMFGGDVTDDKLKLAEQMKLNRTMNDPVEAAQRDLIISKAQRLQEKAPFFAALQQAGVDPNQHKAWFNEYDNARPVFDAKTKSINGQNLNSWPDFLQKKLSGQDTSAAPQSVRSYDPSTGKFN